MTHLCTYNLKCDAWDADMGVFIEAEEEVEGDEQPVPGGLKLRIPPFFPHFCLHSCHIL